MRVQQGHGIFLEDLLHGALRRRRQSILIWLILRTTELAPRNTHTNNTPGETRLTRKN